DDLVWQPRLWRLLRDELGVPAPAELLDQACAAVGAGPAFSVFGATRIAPARVRALAAVAEHRDVHLWLHHPSPALWQQVRGERPGPRRGRPPAARNPLLASLSRDVRELQQLLTAGPHHDEHLPPAGTRPDTLLGRLQHELSSDEVPLARGPLDASLQVHAAHGPARQVEVVREVVLGLLADDPTLEPRDIVIMCPDVETFAPLVAASFGSVDADDGHPAAALRVRLADRSLRQTNPLLGLLGQLLELANGRVTATGVLDVAGAPPVRRRFGFDDDDIERLRDWTVAAGARWGLDAEHRRAYGLGGLAQNTWRSAVDRLLVGVTMEDAGGWVGDTLPLDDVDSADIDLAGRFAELLDRVGAAVDALSGTHGAREWATLLADAVLGLGEASEAWQSIQLRRELAAVAEHAPEIGAVFGLPDVTALLRDRLAGRPSRASFRTGTLTVCTLVPMRSVPHRVICLIGLDDDAFPRRGIADGDDVLAREPRSGERDVRSEDRQLFLDAICAAQEHLVITYSGADPRTGAEIPPCVPLGELLDAVDATATGPGGAPAREHLVVRHPLQPFDRRNFTAGALGREGPFSFDRSALSGARAALQARVPTTPPAAVQLPPDSSDVVELDDLVRFFQHPVRGFLRQRLGISTYESDDDPSDAMTVELDGLQGWAVGDRVLRHCLAGMSRQAAAALEYRRGELPPLQLGQAQLEVIGRRVDALLAACEAERAVAPTSAEIDVALAGGRSLVGTVSGVRGSTLLDVTYSTLAPKHRLTAWIRYLALVAATGDTTVRALTVGRRSNDARRLVYTGVSGGLAVQCLDLLVRLRDDGLRTPLPLALATSADYAERRETGASLRDALPGAAKAWESDRFRPERDEPEHVLVHGAGSTLSDLRDEPAGPDDVYPDEPTRFGALARLVWGPLLTVERAG
ncbi:exodeoxyribonuclease V subunit gamma, partial [Jatrophihabitans endophyticus]|uniref:exodeoxyribonuclease V subunit gamma n=1 Tax=Jatrophihabitans endophyticus TaxID=1206085 RepID=UPI0019F30F1C